MSEKRLKLVVTLAVRGVTFNNRQEAVALINPGEFLDLCRELDNPHDANAVSVWSKGKKLGYIPREVAPLIASLLDEGKNLLALVQRVHETVLGLNVIKTPIVDILMISEDGEENPPKTHVINIKKEVTSNGGN